MPDYKFVLSNLLHAHKGTRRNAHFCHEGPDFLSESSLVWGLNSLPRAPATLSLYGINTFLK